jgi:poly-gamma-glutamate synthesis protein (capsule biosynthesis protein)
MRNNLSPGTDVVPDGHVRVFLAGDVMLGRGIDQIQRSSCPPGLHEEWVRSARAYVTLAERASGPIPTGVDPAYVWGDALAWLQARAPSARIVNLETALTLSETWEPKGINYRAHPANVSVLHAAGIDCVSLANNHVLDWGEEGLFETLDTLAAGGIPCCGAGRDLRQACRPRALDLGSGNRMLVLGLGTPDAGIPPSWRASEDRPGVWLLSDAGSRSLREVRTAVERERRPGDLVLASLHWGGNWGYPVSAAYRRLARSLIDEAGIHVIHGHSSHHPRGLEVHDGHLILHGCGDFINDYEGIGGREEFRGDLVVAYLPTLDRGSGRLVDLEMAPFRLRRFRLETAGAQDLAHVHTTLDREVRRLGGSGVDREAGVLRLRDPAGRR